MPASGFFHAEFGDPQAPLLLMVHGFPTSSIDWQDVAGELSASYRLCASIRPALDSRISPKPRAIPCTVQHQAARHHLTEIIGAHEGAVAAHDRGDSVALSFARRCATGQAPFDLTSLVLSNGNVSIVESDRVPAVTPTRDGSFDHCGTDSRAARRRIGADHFHASVCWIIRRSQRWQIRSR